MKNVGFFLFLLSLPISGMHVIADGFVSVSQAIFLLKKLPEPYNDQAFFKSIVFGLARMNFSEFDISKQYERYVKACFLTSVFINNECKTVREITKNVFRGKSFSRENNLLLKRLLLESLTTGTVMMTNYLLFLVRDMIV